MDQDDTRVEQIVVGRCDHLGTTGSITLVRRGKLCILVDCGDPWNAPKIERALMNHGCEAEMVTHVVITHGHVDHCGNMAMFVNAEFIMATDCLSRAETVSPACSTVKFPITFFDNIIIHQMSGHTTHDLVVQVFCHNRVYFVVGDLFEEEFDEDKWPANSLFPEKQREARDLILQQADFIIPGHGPIFTNHLHYQPIPDPPQPVSR